MVGPGIFCEQCGKELDPSKRNGSRFCNKTCSSTHNAIVGRRVGPDNHMWNGGSRAHILYPTYNNMIQRCYNQERPDFHNYGGRGISVCESWKSNFWEFVKDMGERPEGMTLDRTNNDGPYSPENCVWSTRKTQGRNQRTNNLIEAFGETKTRADWSEDPRCSVDYFTIRYRIDAGWDPEDAITTPSWGEAKSRRSRWSTVL